MEWLLILGAGASMASPTQIPGFDQLRNSILAAVGWNWDSEIQGWTRTESIAGVQPPSLVSTRLTARGAPAEVVFGTLHRFGIPFATQVEAKLLAWTPPYNAVHAVAAEVLRKGGPVWTPNIDVAIETAYGDDELDRVVVGQRGPDRLRLPFVAEAITTGTLLKFHGSVDRPDSLAFTDMELLAPYTSGEVEHLASLALGRRAIIYGYRGVDADLHDVIAAALVSADDVRWFEPSAQARRDIERSFGSVVAFDPPDLPDGGRNFPTNVQVTAEAFMAAAEADRLGAACPADLRAHLGVLGTKEIRFDLDVPAIVDARLVERFGPKADERPVLNAARRADLLRWPPRAVRGHARWALSASLYNSDGIVHGLVGTAARRPTILNVVPARVSDYVYDKGPAVLLPEGDYIGIHNLAAQARSEHRRHDPLRRGSDLYYLAHSLRYLNRIDEARDALDEASALLVDRLGRSDTERYSGVLLERGCVALHQGRVTEAMVAAEALVAGPGRYAIPSWGGWGHWLAGMAHLYSVAVHDHERLDDAADEAERHVRLGEEIFTDADHQSGLCDLYLVRLVAHRIRLADGQRPDMPVRPGRLSLRQEHDEHLVMADISVAIGDLAEANRRLAAVERAPANEVAAAWAALGRAELIGIEDPARADPMRMRIMATAEESGARWLACQAALATSDVAQIDATSVRRIGLPRILWLIT